MPLFELDMQTGQQQNPKGTATVKETEATTVTEMARPMRLDRIKVERLEA